MGDGGAIDSLQSRLGLRADVYVKSGAFWIHARLIPGAEDFGGIVR